MAGRRLLQVSVGLVALVVALLAMAHAPLVRARVLGWLVGRAQSDLDLHLAAGRLDYNLFALTAELGTVELRATNAEVAFFTADAVRIDLPWSIIGGTIGVHALEVDRPRLHVVRQLDGTLNLPRSTADTKEPSTPTNPIHIDHLVVSDLELRYADAPAQMSVEGRGVTVALDRALGGRLEGELSMVHGATIRVGDRQTTIDTLKGRLGFDGRALAVDELMARMPEGQLRLDGTIDLLAAEPRVDVRYAGRADLERLAPWLGVEPPPHGEVALSGRARGPFERLDLTTELRGEALRWSTLEPVSINARAAVSGNSATVESVRIALADGEVTGDAMVPLDANGNGGAHLRWSGLDIGAIAAAAALDLGGLRLASRADGSATLDWTGRALIAGRGTVDTRLTAGSPSVRALGVEGRSVLTLDRGNWQLSLDHRLDVAGVVAGKVGGQLDTTDLAASTIGGHVTAHVPQVDTAIRRLQAAGIAFDASAVQSLRAGVNVAAVLDGTLRSPRATGSLHADGLRYGGIGPARARVDFVATAGDAVLESARVELGPNALDARVVLDFASKTVSGDVTATLVDLDALATMLPAMPAEWRPEGSARVQARVTGALANPTVAATLTSDDVRVGGQTIRTVHGTTRMENRVVFVDSLELTQDVGRLSVAGHYRIADERYTFEATGADLAIVPIVPRAQPELSTTANAGREAIPIDARVSLRLAGAGTLTSPSARGSAAVSRLVWDGYPVGEGRLDATVEQGAAHVTASLPQFPVAVDGTIQIAAPHAFTARATLADATLRRLVATASPTASFIDPDMLRGAVSLDATASGTLNELTAADVDLEVRLADVAVNGAPITLERPARLDYSKGQLVARDLELRTGQTTLVASGRLGGRADSGEALAASVNGSLGDLLPFARLTPSLKALDASGRFDARIRARGAWDAPQIDGELALDSATVTSGSLPAVRDIALRASYDRGMLDLQDVRAEWQGAIATATGQVPATLLGDRLPESYRRALPDLPGHARASVRIAPVTQAVLAPFLDQATIAEVDGRADVVATLEAAALSLEAVTADITLDRADVELARVPIGQTRPTRVRLADGRLSVLEWAWAGAGSRLNLGGSADIAGQTPQLNLTARGTLDLRMLGAFSRGVVTGGTAALDVSISGTSDAPTLGGQVLFRDGSVIVRDPRFAVAGLEGGLDLAGDRLVLRDVTANANGGTVRVAGDVQLPGFTLASGTLTISGRGMALEVPAGLRTEVDTDLQLALSQTDPSLTGTVTILRGSYREPLSLTNQLLTGAQVPQAQSVEDEADPSVIDRLRLGIGVVSAEDIRVDNNYGRLEVGSNLRVIGTLAQPALAGRVVFEEGSEVFLGGHTYRLRRGTVDFTNATRIEPDVDFALETRVQDYDITLQVRGTPETIEATLSSPRLSQADVVSLLLTGGTAAEFAGSTSLEQTEVARRQLLPLLSGEILGFAGRAVGLDTVQVSQGLGAAASTFDLLGTDVDANARVTLGKSLRRDVELVFSQNLRDTGDITWIATYQPLRNVVFRGTTQDDSTRSYEFRHELDFGGSRPARVPRADRVERQPGRVAAVTFAGRPGFEERQLRRRLQLKAGSRFDFYRWQRDRERLERFYHARDFLEVRIAAQRTEPVASSPGLGLIYAIDRGPRTVLIVEGYVLPERLIERMKQAWAEAVFDGFLVEDLEEMAAGQLLADGYLHGEAKGELAPSTDDGGTKRLVLRITPGTRFETRRIAFSGFEHLTSDALDDFVQSRGLDVSGWAKPNDLEVALERHYESIGYLSATVTVDPPVFSGASATLPVRITEGPLFQVGGVEIQGAQPTLEREVRQAFGLATGATYVPSSVEPARRAVEARYLRDGYNDVRVSATTRVNRDRASVDVALRIEEGRPQVLSQVEVAGAETTARAVIDRALALEPGTPASLASAQRAQKRLYDTGVFRVADIQLEPLEVSGGPTQAMRAVVQVQELPTYRFRYGFRVSDRVGPTEVGRDVQPAFVVDLLRRNLLGRAVTTGLSGQVERHRKLARAVVSLPDLFGLPLTTSLFFTRSREMMSPANETVFIDDVSSITAEQRFRPSPRMSVTYGYSLSRTRVYDPDPNPFLPPLDARANVGRFTGAFSWDTRDDPANARSGWFQSSGLEVATPSLGSDLRFVRYLAQQYYFRSVGPGVVLGSAIRFGAGRDFDTGLLQERYRFLSGGATSVRGFAEDRLGPRDRFGEPGGNGLLLLNHEVRFPIFRWLRGVSFVDAGNVFTSVRDVSVGRLDAGAGIGLRLHSPFLLLRIDYGVPLTRRDREPAGRWYFGIGQAF